MRPDPTLPTTRCGRSAGVIWDGWGRASARPQASRAPMEGAGSGSNGPSAAQRPAPRADADPAAAALPYMQVAAAWLARADARARTACLLEAVLLRGGCAAALQVAPVTSPAANATCHPPPAATGMSTPWFMRACSHGRSARNGRSRSLCRVHVSTARRVLARRARRQERWSPRGGARPGRAGPRRRPRRRTGPTAARGWRWPRGTSCRGWPRILGR